jgi:hypothetical protein
MEVTRRRGRRRKKLLDDLKDRRGFSHLKEETLGRTMWRNRFGGGFGPVVRQNNKWMNVPVLTNWQEVKLKMVLVFVQKIKIIYCCFIFWYIFGRRTSNQTYLPECWMCDILLISHCQQRRRYAVPLRTVTKATGYNRNYCLEIKGEFPFSDFPKRQTGIG